MGTNISFRESIQSLDTEKEHAPHLKQQHKSTCHSGHFHHARWRILLQEYVRAK